MRSKWMLRTTKVDIKELAKECGISGIVAKILVNRGIDTPEAIHKFLYGNLSDLYDPYLMKDMKKGVDIIEEGIINNRKIVIYGDYDADGVTSTVVLYKALKKCGANVQYYVPDREEEGYGMCSSRVEILREEGYEIILTCDNGISAMEEIKLAKSLGFTVVVTDHHELPFKEIEEGEREYMLPEADAVINPKRKDCEYPFKYLCGAGIAFKFSCALFERFNIDKKEIDDIIQYAGMGTICDVVDLVDENRIIAKYALEKITNSSNPGIKALKEAIGIGDRKIKSYNIGFQIGPCINATGRLDTAALSVELFLCEDYSKAEELAKKLFELNKIRQDITNENVVDIVEQIKNSDTKNHKVMVIYKEDVHESIAGIVSGRIREIFNVPSLVITKGKEMPKGSGRSIEEYNLFEELMKCKDLLEKFGGHPMAAGLSLREENISKLRERLNSNCTLTEEDLIPKLRIDNRLPLDYISYELIEEIEKLEPFGKGNSSPVLAERNIPIEKIFVFGKERNVLKFRCRIPNKNIFIDAVSFNKTEEFEEMLREEYGDNYYNIMHNPGGLKLDFIFVPSINEYNGNVSIQLKVSDFRLSKGN